MADVPVLLCTGGLLDGQRFSVPEGGLQIGRSKDNDVVIDDDGVSRFHVRLLYDNGSLWIQDAGSRNGVFVNGQRVTDHRALKVDDVITIDQHEFTVQWANGDEDESGVFERDPSEGEGGSSKWWWPFG